MNTLRIVSIILSIVIVSAANAGAQDDLSPQALKLQEHVKYLSDDSMMGRLVGSKECYKAAEYLKEQFKAAGLQPFAGAYSQEMPYAPELVLTEKNKTAFNVIIPRPGIPAKYIKPVTRNWQLGKEWRPMRFSENGHAEAPMVFVGMGISMPDGSYDDYAGVDVKGKVVIVLADSIEGKSKTEFFQPYADIRYKAKNAKEHGAAAVIFVKVLSDSANTFYNMNLKKPFQSEGIIAINSTRVDISKFFQKTKSLITAEAKILETLKPNSFELPNATIIIDVDMSQKARTLPNVVGMIKGTELPDEYIIVAAHLDGAGEGEIRSKWVGWGRQIHNSADDNASGCAALVEMGRNLKNAALKRSVLFIAFNGEEDERIGSKYYCANPLVPAANTVSMLDIDMIGRLRGHRLNVKGTNTFSYISHPLDSLAKESPVKLARVNNEIEPGPFLSFSEIDVPYLLFHTGGHTQFHRPTDKWDRCNYEGMDAIVNYLDEVVKYLANVDERPTYVSEDEDEEDANSLDGTEE